MLPELFRITPSGFHFFGFRNNISTEQAQMNWSAGADTYFKERDVKNRLRGLRAKGCEVAISKEYIFRSLPL
jgi:hypothetical protein